MDVDLEELTSPNSTLYWAGRERVMSGWVGLVAPWSASLGRSRFGIGRPADDGRGV